MRLGGKVALITGGARLVLPALVIGISLFLGCDGRDRVRLNDGIPIESRDDLSPPIVHEPIHECGRAVEVTGFTPDAHVRVYADLVDVVGEAIPHFGFTEIELTRPIESGESITATQTVDGIESGHSLSPVDVTALPEFTDGVPPRPEIASKIYACGRVVPVGGLVPGVRVFVAEDGLPVGSANAAGTWKDVSTNPLNEGRPVVATQVTCADVTDKNPLESLASPAVNVLPVPDPFQPPKVDDSTLIVGNNSVTLHDLYVGAAVTVLEGSHALGSGYANSTTNWVPLLDPIESTWLIRGKQALCATNATSDPIEPTTEVPTPLIVGPVCDTDEYVRVRGTVINATVALLRNGGGAGLAGATPGDLLLPRGEPFAPGDELTVRQYFGENASPASAPVTVYACSDEWLRGRINEILSGAPSKLQPAAFTASSIGLFQNADPFEVLQVTLRADFDTINGEPNKDDAKSPGTLTYVDPISAIPVNVNVTVEARGKSRFTACAWRPLRLRFGSDPAGTLLEGTGKVIKIVTHCGFKLSGSPFHEWLSEGTTTEQTRRLMQEFALYEVLGTTGSAALETRLALITYQDPAGTPLETHYAFFREREKRAAERGGFQRLESDEGDPRLPPNATSDFQVRFHHRFIFSHDYNHFDPGAEHNVVRMGSPSGMEYYIPFDFDLSGIIRPEYSKNNGWSIEENGEDLVSWLESWPDQDLVRVQVASLLQHEDEMRQRVGAGLVDAEGKARLMAWFEDHVRRLKCYLN